MVTAAHTALALILLGVSAGTPSFAADVETFHLPPTPLSQLGNPGITDTVLARARQAGLLFTNLPSIGSGLARVGADEYVGITDRGPTGTLAVKGRPEKTFPLPEFCPTIVRFKLAAGQIQITRCIPLRDAQGKLLPGRSHHADPTGLDPEAIRVLPDGKFILGDESAPSIAVISPDGEVLVRYTPGSKPLRGAAYAVKAILPDSLTQRRSNRGFENLALARDGKSAYAILQSPMGDELDPRYRNSRTLRVLKLDVTEPDNARVAGEFLAPTSPAREYSRKQKQEQITWSDADWVGPERLLVIERGKDLAKLVLVDLTTATDILHHEIEPGLQFEATPEGGFARLGVRLASVSVVHTVRQLPGVTRLKLEGLVVLNEQTVLLAHDNDFGGGDHPSGLPSTVWRVRLPRPIPDFR
jgi:hypothetical protein